MTLGKNSHGKRAIDIVDLTGSDDATYDAPPRKIPRPSPTDGITQSQRDSWVVDDEDDADAVIILSQDGNDGDMESFELYGMIIIDEP